MPVTSSVRLTGTVVFVQPRSAPAASQDTRAARNSSNATARRMVLLILTAHCSSFDRQTQKGVRLGAIGRSDSSAQAAVSGTRFIQEVLYIRASRIFIVSAG